MEAHTSKRMTFFLHSSDGVRKIPPWSIPPGEFLPIKGLDQGWPSYRAGLIGGNSPGGWGELTRRKFSQYPSDKRCAFLSLLLNEFMQSKIMHEITQCVPKSICDSPLTGFWLLRRGKRGDGQGGEGGGGTEKSA